MLDIVYDRIVTSSSLQNEIELEQLVDAMPNASFDPDQFPGIIHTPDGTECEIFIINSGQVLFNGGNDPAELKRLYETFFFNLPKWLEEAAIEIDLPDKPPYLYQNIIGHIRVADRFDLDGIETEFKNEPSVEFLTTHLNGLIYRIPEPLSFVIILQDGRLISGGTRRMIDFYSSFQRIMDALRNHGFIVSPEIFDQLYEELQELIDHEAAQQSEEESFDFLASLEAMTAEPELEDDHETDEAEEVETLEVGEGGERVERGEEGDGAETAATAEAGEVAPSTETAETAESAEPTVLETVPAETEPTTSVDDDEGAPTDGLPTDLVDGTVADAQVPSRGGDEHEVPLLDETHPAAAAEAVDAVFEPHPDLEPDFVPHTDDDAIILFDEQEGGVERGSETPVAPAEQEQELLFDLAEDIEMEFVPEDGATVDAAPGSTGTELAPERASESEAEGEGKDKGGGEAAIEGGGQRGRMDGEVDEETLAEHDRDIETETVPHPTLGEYRAQRAAWSEAGYRIDALANTDTGTDADADDDAPTPAALADHLEQYRTAITELDPIRKQLDAMEPGDHAGEHAALVELARDPSKLQEVRDRFEALTTALETVGEEKGAAPTADTDTDTVSESDTDDEVASTEDEGGAEDRDDTDDKDDGVESEDDGGDGGDADDDEDDAEDGEDSPGKLSKEEYLRRQKASSMDLFALAKQMKQ